MVRCSRFTVGSMKQSVLVLMLCLELGQALTSAGTFFAFTSRKFGTSRGSSYSVADPPDPWARLRSILSEEMSKLPAMLDNEFDMRVYNISRDIGVEIRSLGRSVTQELEHTLPAYRPSSVQSPGVPQGLKVIAVPERGPVSPTVPTTSVMGLGTTAIPELVTVAQSSAGHMEASLRHMHSIADEIKEKVELEVNRLRSEFKSSMEVLQDSITNITSSRMILLEKHLEDQTKKVKESLEVVLLSGKKGIETLQKKFGKISRAIDDMKKNTPYKTTTPIPTTATPVYTEKTTELLEEIVNSLGDVYDSIRSSVSEEEEETQETTTPTPYETTTEEQVDGRECTEVLHNGHTTSGVYRIKVDDLPVQTVYCDQDTDGGGWTVFLARRNQNGSWVADVADEGEKNETEDSRVNFKRDWQEYKKPFGNADGEYWIGLETLHALTKNVDYELYVDMETHNDTTYSRYKFFGIGSEELYRTGYVLSVYGFDPASPGGDAMAVHNGKDFTTIDEDNDDAPGGNCAQWCGGGGWWYHYCFRTNPTGRFPPEDMEEDIQEDTMVEWRTWKGDYVYLEAITFKIRPKDGVGYKKSLKDL